MIIDAHQHFWQLSRPFDFSWLDSPQHKPIRRDYLPEDLEPMLGEAGVQRSVFVQTQHDVEENRWVLALAEQHAFIAGVVGWIDLASPACEDQLLEFNDHPKFVGIRHITHDEPDDNFIVRPEIIRGLKVLEKHRTAFDLLFHVRHLKHVPTLARELPTLPMVIDHLAKPRIKSGEIDDWRTDLWAAAQFPNVYCKLSGMVTEADWQDWNTADLKPYVETALAAFGPQRCMYGSDWPVCELAATYGQVFESLTELIGGLSESERSDILGKTAERFYGLCVS